MKVIRIFLLGMALFSAGWVMAETAVAVVVSERSPIRSLSIQEVTAIFMGTTGSAGGRDIRPVDSADAELREIFYQLLVGRNRNQIRAYWSRMVFTGQGAPPAILDREKLLRSLTIDEQLIAYVRSDEVIPGTRTLFRLP